MIQIRIKLRSQFCVVKRKRDIFSPCMHYVGLNVYFERKINEISCTNIAQFPCFDDSSHARLVTQDTRLSTLILLRHYWVQSSADDKIFNRLKKVSIRVISISD